MQAVGPDDVLILSVLYDAPLHNRIPTPPYHPLSASCAALKFLQSSHSAPHTTVMLKKFKQQRVELEEATVEAMVQMQ